MSVYGDCYGYQTYGDCYGTGGSFFDGSGITRGEIDLPGGTSIGGILDILQRQGQEALIEWLVEQGLGEDEAQVIAQVAVEAGEEGLNALFGGGSGGGGSSDTNVPNSVPNDPQTNGPVAGTVFKRTGSEGESRKVYPGLYNFNDLSNGWHDAIASATMKEGFRGTFYKHVSEGDPYGESQVVGPGESVDFRYGLGNEISAFVVENLNAGGGGFFDGGGNGGGGGGGTGGMSNTTILVLSAIGLFFLR